MCAGLAAFLGGCAPAARVELASLEFRTIDPPSARFIVVEAERCYWWQEPSGRVRIALEQRRDLPVIDTQFTFVLGLTLAELPAGQAREYQVEADELVAVASIGFTESRFAAEGGILAIYRERGEQLRGSLRLRVSRETLQLMGWGGKTSYLMLASFVAQHDETRGKAILTRLEP